MSPTTVPARIIHHLALRMLYFILEPMLLHVVLRYLLVAEHKVIDIILQSIQNRRPQILFMN